MTKQLTILNKDKTSIPTVQIEGECSKDFKLMMKNTILQTIYQNRIIYWQLDIIPIKEKKNNAKAKK